MANRQMGRRLVGNNQPSYDSFGSSSSNLVASSTDKSHIVAFLEENLDQYGRMGRSGVSDCCNESKQCAYCTTVLSLVTLLALLIACIVQIYKLTKEDHTLPHSVANLFFTIGALIMSIIFVLDGMSSSSGMKSFDTNKFNRLPATNNGNNAPRTNDNEMQPPFAPPPDHETANPVTIKRFSYQASKYCGIGLLLIIFSGVLVSVSAVQDELFQHPLSDFSKLRAHWPHLLLAFPMAIVLYVLFMLCLHIKQCTTIIKALNADIRFKIRNLDATLDWPSVREHYLLIKYLIDMFNHKPSVVLSVGFSVLVVKLVDILRIFIYACYAKSWLFGLLSFTTGLSLLLVMNCLLFYFAKVSIESAKTRWLLTEFLLRVPPQPEQDVLRSLETETENTNDTDESRQDRRHLIIQVARRLSLSTREGITNTMELLGNRQADICVNFYNSTPITPDFIVAFNFCFIAYGKILQYLVPLQTQNVIP